MLSDKERKPLLSVITRTMAEMPMSCIISGTRLTEFTSGHATSAAVSKPGERVDIEIVRDLPIVNENDCCRILQTFFKVSDDDLLLSGIMNQDDEHLPLKRHGLLYARPRFTANLIRRLLTGPKDRPFANIVLEYLHTEVINMSNYLTRRQITPMPDLQMSFYSLLAGISAGYALGQIDYKSNDMHMTDLISTGLLDYTCSMGDGDACSSTDPRVKRHEGQYTLRIVEPLVISAIDRCLGHGNGLLMLTKTVTTSMIQLIGTSGQGKGQLFELLVAAKWLTLKNRDIRALVKQWCGGDVAVPSWLCGVVSSLYILRDPGGMVPSLLINNDVHYVLMPNNTARPDIMMRVGDMMVLCGCKLYAQTDSAAFQDNRESTDLTKIYTKLVRITNGPMRERCVAILKNKHSTHTLRLVFNIACNISSTDTTCSGAQHPTARYESSVNDVIVTFNYKSLVKYFGVDAYAVIQQYCH